MKLTTISAGVNAGSAATFSVDVRAHEVALACNVRLMIPAADGLALERRFGEVFSPENLATEVAWFVRDVGEETHESTSRAKEWNELVKADNDGAPNDAPVELVFAEDLWPKVSRIAKRIGVTEEELIRSALRATARLQTEEEEAEQARVNREAKHAALPGLYRELLKGDPRTISKSASQTRSWLHGEFLRIDPQAGPFPEWKWTAEQTPEGMIRITMPIPLRLDVRQLHGCKFEGMIRQMTVIGGGKQPRHDFDIAWFGYGGAPLGILRSIRWKPSSLEDDVDEFGDCSFNLEPDLYRVIEWISEKVGTNPGVWCYGCIAGFFNDYRGGFDAIQEAPTPERPSSWKIMPSDWKGGFDERPC